MDSSLNVQLGNPGVITVMRFKENAKTPRYLGRFLP